MVKCFIFIQCKWCAFTSIIQNSPALRIEITHVYHILKSVLGIWHQNHIVGNGWSANLNVIMQHPYSLLCSSSICPLMYDNGELFPPCRVPWRTGNRSDSINLCRTSFCTFLYVSRIATSVFVSTGVFIAEVPSVVYGHLKSHPLSASFLINWAHGYVKSL